MRTLLTYYTNDSLGSVDMPMKDADINIENSTEDFHTEYLRSIVKGMFTFKDAIEQEIEYHKTIKKNCEEYGFGNSRRLAIHNLKILEAIMNRYNAESEKGSNLTNTQKSETIAEQEIPETFEGLFYNKNFVNPCINILKEVAPPLIDGDCNFIGNLKSGIVIWIEEMQRQAVIKSNYPQERKLLALLIPQKIKRFSIDESMFSKHSMRAESQYRIDIKAMVSKIKHSQNSQTESRES